MMMRILAAIGLGTGCLLLAADQPKPDGPKQKVQVSKTERIDFPSGGALRFRNSVGVLTVTAWDRPDVEMTTIKSTKVEFDARGREKGTRVLEGVNVATERHGDELVIATTFPSGMWRPMQSPHRPFRVFYPLSGQTNFDLEYQIKAPANARIIADHTLGDVNIDSVVGDIQVTLSKGEITLHLPEEEKYAIHAKSDFGNVNSDFPGEVKRLWWLLGHRSVKENSMATHKLNLRVGFGDIVIVKTRIPKYPDPAAQKTGGL
jgi:Putative adhesin